MVLFKSRFGLNIFSSNFKVFYKKIILPSWFTFFSRREFRPKTTGRSSGSHATFLSIIWAHEHQCEGSFRWERPMTFGSQLHLPSLLPCLFNIVHLAFLITLRVCGFLKLILIADILTSFICGLSEMDCMVGDPLWWAEMEWNWVVTRRKAIRRKQVKGLKIRNCIQKNLAFFTGTDWQLQALAIIPFPL